MDHQRDGDTVIHARAHSPAKSPDFLDSASQVNSITKHLHEMTVLHRENEITFQLISRDKDSTTILLLIIIFLCNFLTIKPTDPWVNKEQF